MPVHRHPWAGLAGLAGFTLWMLGTIQAAIITLLSPLSPLLEPLVVTAGQWFSIIAIFGATVAPNVSWLDEQAATGVLVAGGIVFGLIKISQLIDALQRRYSNS